MTKPKAVRRYIRMYAMHFKKKMFLRVSNFLDDKSPVKKYSVTPEAIDKAGDVLDKLFKMIESCKYCEQLDVADRYVDMYATCFPFAIILEEILRRKIEKKKLVTEYYDLDLATDIISKKMLEAQDKHNKYVEYTLQKKEANVQT